MQYTGKDILKDEKLKEFLISYKRRVMKIIWGDGSVTSGLGEDISIEEVNGRICICDGLWSEPITEKMILVVKDISEDLQDIYEMVIRDLLSYYNNEVSVQEFIDIFEETGLDYTNIIDMGRGFLADRFVYYYECYPLKIEQYAKLDRLILELQHAIKLIDESIKTKNIPSEMWRIIPQHQFVHVINSHFKSWNKNSDVYDFIKYVFRKRDYDSNLINIKILKESFANCSEDNLKQSIEYIKDNFEVTNNKVTIYRGVQDKSTELSKSLSWTLNKDVALFFAKRFPSNQNIIYETTVDLDDIIGFIKDEEEVIVQYKNLKDEIKTHVVYLQISIET